MIRTISKALFDTLYESLFYYAVNLTIGSRSNREAVVLRRLIYQQMVIGKREAFKNNRYNAIPLPYSVQIKREVKPNGGYWLSNA